MSEVEVNEKLAKSLTTEGVELLPFIPYLLQDLWELGGSPTDIEMVMRKHISVPSQLRVLDLGCGKGAVSIHLARIFGCHVKGIDLIPDFIDCARQQAESVGVQGLCDFVVGDINQAVLIERDYDVVVLAAVGDVLGDQAETLDKLKRVVKDDGYIVIDDVYSRQEDANTETLSYQQWLRLFEQKELLLLEARPGDEASFRETNAAQQAHIRQRARELQERYPDKAALFSGYVASQQAEVDELESDLVGITWLLKKTAS